jgi:hypothetical protein
LFNLTFLELEATVGGETGIDISLRGNNKSQVLQDFNEDDNIIFFGDAIKPGGNDYPLAQANTNGMNYHVIDWKQTWSILNAYSTNRP